MLDFGFYNMDCMDGMKEFSDGYFDLAIVDPPYGINVGKASMGIGGWRGSSPEPLGKEYQNRVGGAAIIGGAKPFGKNQSGRGLVIIPKIYKAFDDSHTPNAAYFAELARVAKKESFGVVIIFLNT